MQIKIFLSRTCF